MSAPAQHSIHSELWHRAARLRPRLRPDAQIERHVVRDRVWYVVGDRFSTRTHRVTPAVYAVLARMDGRRTLDAIWREVAEQFGADAPAQDQILGVVAQLYAAEIVRSDRPVDEAELTERADQHVKRVASQSYKNPVFLKIPLFDPDRFLSATVHLVRPFSGVLGGLLWLTAIVWLAIQAAVHWRELSEDVVDKVLAGDSLLVLLLVFPVLKLLHELGHAYAVKLLGGAVHEVGISLLTFMPAPYVDASASSLLPSRWQRALVGAAGMIVELAVAALAMVVWLNSESGLVRSVAYDTMFIAGVSTILFNANPLLRFDGYYILTDLLGLPNLATRAQRLYLAFAQRKLFGMREAPMPEMSPGELPWLLVYAPASLVYRAMVVVGIALFVGNEYFFFGVALVAWMVVTTFVWPLLKGLHYVLLSPSVADHRVRAVLVTLGSIGAIAAGIAFLPIPYGTVASAVVWIPEEANIVTGTAGQVVRVVKPHGSVVEAGEPLVELVDPFIANRRAGQEARLAEFEARLTAADPRSPLDTQLIRQQVQFARDELTETLRRQRNLVVRSPRAGTFILPRPDDLGGSYLKQGQLIGYVMAGEAPVIRATVPADDIDLVRTRTVGVSVRLPGSVFEPIAEASTTREVPAATRKLPSKALAANAGGPFSTDPGDREGETSLLPLFLVDVAIRSDRVRDLWGTRAFVRFDHGASPMLPRWWRAGRQVFLGRFSV